MLRRTPRQQCCGAANVRPFGPVGEAEVAKRSCETGTTTTPMPTMTLNDSSAASSTELSAVADGFRRRADFINGGASKDHPHFAQN